MSWMSVITNGYREIDRVSPLWSIAILKWCPLVVEITKVI
jgi:hypothetical protein